MSDLRGKRVVITRPREQAEDFARLLRDAGAQVIFFPTIRIQPAVDPSRLDRALRELDCYHWLVLTSVNGVQAVWQRLEALGIGELPPGLRVAAIGPQTAAALEQRGVHPDFVPGEYIAEAILPGLGDLRGKRVLLARAEQARRALSEAITHLGGQADEVTAYHTVPAEPDPHTIEELRAGVDIITFTSSSTVRSFCALVEAAGLDPLHLPGNPLVACIGPITAGTACELGLPVQVVAQEYTTAGLVRALLEVESQKNK